MTTARTGRVKTIVADRGFGFVETPAGDFFFHCQEVRPPVKFANLRVGDRVEFEEQRDTGHGLRATILAVLP